MEGISLIYLIITFIWSSYYHYLVSKITLGYKNVNWGIFSSPYVILWISALLYYNKLKKLKEQIVVISFFHKWLIVYISTIFLISLICHFLKNSREYILWLGHIMYIKISNISLCTFFYFVVILILLTNLYIKSFLRSATKKISHHSKV